MAIDETKPKNGNGVRYAMEWFRLITPVMVTISLFILGNISLRIGEIDSKLFTHLTNHELHIPRQDVVTKAQFQMHCQFSDEAKARFEKSVDQMRQDVSELIGEIRAHATINGGGK